MNNLNFGFVGLGLIGGSIAKALRRAYPDCKIYVYDTNTDSTKKAVSELVVNAAISIGPDFGICDYIFMCAPVEYNNENLEKIIPFIKESCIITDVGSVKGPIVEAINKLGITKSFIGGHPMAGSERFGYSNSKPGILENAYYILTPTDDVPTAKVDEFRLLIKSIGAIPIVLSSETHDYVTGAISHLPHVISAALVNLIKNQDTSDGVMKMVAAGGFKDITRISSSSPEMWQQICLENNQNIETLLNEYIKALEEIKKQIASSSSDRLYDFFSSAREYRESFISSNSGPIKAEYVITVDIADKPGAIAAIASLLSMHSINIKNIGINHNREFAEGALRIEFYDEVATTSAIQVMNEHGYNTHSKKY